MRQNWQLWEGALSPSECDELIALCKQECTMNGAGTFSGETNGIRKTNVGWTQNPKVQEIMRLYATTANDTAFQVDADILVSSQFGEYSDGGFYTWHHDVDWCRNDGFDRKITTIIQLTDPEEYKGGEFEFKYIETPTAFRTRGSILCFVSYLEHRVKPVTEGVRHSIVNWMEGPKWR